MKSKYGLQPLTGLRKLQGEERNSEDAIVQIRIYRNAEFNEWVVIPFAKGLCNGYSKTLEDLWYYTNDKNDARLTRDAMVIEYNKKEVK